MNLDTIQSFSGIEFENYLYDLFTDLGYHAQKTNVTGDYGVDLILEAPGVKIAVQAKRYKNNVGFSAVQEVYTGMSFYDATEAWIVTTSSFSKQAIEGAAKLGVQLIDGNGITELETISNSNDIALKEIKAYRDDYSGMIKGIEIHLRSIEPKRQFLEDITQSYNSYKDNESYAKEKWPSSRYSTLFYLEMYKDFTSSYWMILPDGSRKIGIYPGAKRLTTLCDLDSSAMKLLASHNNVRAELSTLLKDLRSPDSWSNRDFQDVFKEMMARNTKLSKEVNELWTNFNKFCDQTSITLDSEKEKIITNEAKAKKDEEEKEVSEKGKKFTRFYIESCNEICEEYRKYLKRPAFLTAFSTKRSKMKKELTTKLEDLYSSYIFHIDRIDPEHSIINPIKKITVTSIELEALRDSKTPNP